MSSGYYYDVTQSPSVPQAQAPMSPYDMSKTPAPPRTVDYQTPQQGSHWEFPHDIQLPSGKEEGCNILTCGNKGWCLPVWIYLILSLIGLLGFIFSKHSIAATMVYVIVWLLVIALVVFLMYNLCKNGHTGWAWFLLLLPLIIEIVWIIIVAIFVF